MKNRNKQNIVNDKFGRKNYCSRYMGTNNGLIR